MDRPDQALRQVPSWRRSSKVGLACNFHQPLDLFHFSVMKRSWIHYRTFIIEN